jgi:hypothetical protein
MPGLIGSLSDLFTSPNVNPGLRMVNSQYVDANGNRTTPLVQPNWFQRLGPEGKSIAQVNAEASLNPLQRQQQAQENIAQAQLYGAQPQSIAGMLFSQGTLDPNAATTASRLFADSAAGTFPAEAEAQKRLAYNTSAQNPLEANSFISDAANYRAEHVLPAQNASDIFSELHPGLSNGGLNMFSLDPNSGVTGLVKNPTSPYAPFMGGGGMTGPSGAIYPSAPPGSLNIPASGINQLPPGPPSGTTTIPPQLQGGARPLYGVPARYELDNDNNLYYNGVFVPPETIKGTALEKIKNHQIGAEKEIKAMRNSANLPHGAGNTLRGAAANIIHSFGYPTIPEAYGLAKQGAGLAYHSIFGE